MAKEFIINDENVLNDRGFRVMTAGIRLAQFEKNPLGLFMHARASRWDLKKDTVLPICKWTNLRVEDGKLYGTPEFDQDDDFAVKIEQKVENGFLRMCSLGANPITTSSDEQYLLPGQRFETVVECELIEVSIADLGSNPNSIALYKYDDEEGYVALSSDQSATAIKLINAPDETEKPKSETNMKKIAILLGMSEDSTEDQLVEAISKIKTSEIALKAQVETVQLSAITGAVESAIAEKRITADKKEQMITLGKTIGVDELKSTLELMRPVGKPTEFIKPGGASEGDTTVTLASLMKQGIKAIELYKQDNPAEYAELYEAHYGVKYVAPTED